VSKLRGAQFRGGYHDFNVVRGGIVVYPRLVAAEHRTNFEATPLPSGIVALDRLLGGGLDRGTAALIMGPAGTGKSAIAAQFACAAADRGEHAAMFIFEERIGTLVARANDLGMPLGRHVSDGRIHIHQVDPAELAPDQFTHLVRAAVDEHQAKFVAIDSINGYFNAMPEARFLTLQMHELLSHLGDRGVATALTIAQSGIAGPMTSPVDVSYLADTIVFLRYFEAGGRVRKAISVLKKRSGRHEDAIRELTLDTGGISVGEPLADFRGVLTGVPVFTGDDNALSTVTGARGRS
jgi:circadian clock protein KaiC